SEATWPTDAVRQVHARQHLGPTDLVRSVTAALYAWHLGVPENETDVEDALAALQSVEDPRVRTGFLNQYVYVLVLRAYYENAYEAAETFLNVVNEYQLAWARPHAEWLHAAAAFGTREFALADR